MEIMAANRWEGQHAELAAAWGVSEGTVEHYAGEASRRVKAVGEGDWVRQRISVALDEGLEHGLRLLRRGDPRALGGLAQLAKAFGELAGAKRGAVVDDKAGAEPATFRVELSTPERPPGDPEDACPSGPSSPPAGGPAAG